MLARLAAAFEGRQAIHVEKGIGMLRINGIAADLTERKVSAYVTELPTPGMSHLMPGTNAGPSRFKIVGGYLTLFSAHRWSMGYGGWTLYFDAAAIVSVTALAASLPRDMHWTERYKRVIDCVYLESSWAQPSRVFE